MDVLMKFFVSLFFVSLLRWQLQYRTVTGLHIGIRTPAVNVVHVSGRIDVKTWPPLGWQNGVEFNYLIILIFHLGYTKSDGWCLCLCI